MVAREDRDGEVEEDEDADEIALQYASMERHEVASPSPPRATDWEARSRAGEEEVAVERPVLVSGCSRTDAIEHVLARRRISRTPSSPQASRRRGSMRGSGNEGEEEVEGPHEHAEHNRRCEDREEQRQADAEEVLRTQSH